MKLFVLLAALLSLASQAARIGPAENCRALPVPGWIQVQQCEEGSAVMVKLDIPRPAGALEIYALFPEKRGGMFARLWTAAAAQSFRGGEQAAFRRAALALAENPGAGPAYSLAQFLGFFAPADFVLRDYDFRNRPRQPVARYTMICDRIGRSAVGEFTAFHRLIRKRVIVGSGACIGQCGAGCSDDSNHRVGKYTQECLNHDLCSYATGENMGECEDEFWAAADGFLNAPYCS